MEFLAKLIDPKTNKAAAEYILNPTDHPENQEPTISEHEQELKSKEEELKKKQELLELELAELTHNKTAKIKKEKAKRKTLGEWIQILRNLFSEKFEKHKAIFGISVLLFIAATYLHGISFQIFLKIFFPSMHSEVLLVIALMIALSMEGLATALYESYHNALAYGIYLVGLATIIGMGVYEYATGKPVMIASFRTVLGSLSLIGLFASHVAMRKKEFWESRKTFEQLPKVYRKEINTLLEKCLAEHKAGNSEYRLNFKDLLKTYNLKSPNFEKLLIRKGMRQKNFFQELPPRRRDKAKQQKQTAKKTPRKNES